MVRHFQIEAILHLYISLESVQRTKVLYAFQKKLINETVENLRHLDKESLLIIKSGTEMLKSRDAMDREDRKEGKQGE